MEQDNTGILFMWACIAAGGILGFLGLSGAVHLDGAFGCAESSSAVKQDDEPCDRQEVRWYQKILAGESSQTCSEYGEEFFIPGTRCGAFCVPEHVVSQIRLDYEARTSEPDARAHVVLEEFKRREGRRISRLNFAVPYIACDDRGCLYSRTISFLNDEAHVARLLKGDRGAIAPLPAASASPAASVSQK